MTDVNGIPVNVGDEVICNFLYLWRAKVVETNIPGKYIKVAPGPMNFATMIVTQKEFEIIKKGEE